MCVLEKSLCGQNKNWLTILLKREAPLGAGGNAGIGAAEVEEGPVCSELNSAEEFSWNEGPQSSGLDCVQGLWVEKWGMSLSVGGTVLRGALVLRGQQAWGGEGRDEGSVGC